jgi:multiple sugar transport system substrate-binding protein
MEERMLTRRSFVRASALGAGLVATGSLLAACGDDDVDDDDVTMEPDEPDDEEPDDDEDVTDEPDDEEPDDDEDVTDEPDESDVDESPWAQEPAAPRPDELYFSYWPWGTTEDDLVARFEDDWEVPVVQLAEPNIEPLFNMVNTMYVTGEPLDIIKTLINWLSEWRANEVIRSIDDLPGVDLYKQDMNELCLQAVEADGETWGLPYYQSFFTAAYFEDHFEEAGIEAPPESYDELVEQALQLKQDGVSEYPILWMAAQGGEHVTFEFFQLVHNWGGAVFDQDKNPTLDAGSEAREALAWWQRTFQEWEISAPESLELRFIPAAQAFWTGRYTYHMFTHHYYFNLLNSEAESPIAGRVHPWFLPNGGATLGWTALECMSSTTTSPEWAWMLLQYVGGKTRDGEYTIAKRYAIESMLGSGYDVVNRDPEVMEAWSRWTDVDLTLEQWDQATSTHIAVPAMMEPWFQRWQDAAQVAIQNCLTGQVTADEACDEMIDLHRRLTS